MLKLMRGWNKLPLIHSRQLSSGPGTSFASGRVVKDKMASCLQTFGGLRLVDSESNHVAFPEKGLLILVYLLTTSNGSAYRQELAAFLWSNEDKAVSLSNLRKTVSRIKTRQNELGAQFLSFTEAMIYVDRGSLSSDLLSIDKEGVAEPVARLVRLIDLLKQSFIGAVTATAPILTAGLRNAENSTRASSKIRWSERHLWPAPKPNLKSSMMRPSSSSEPNPRIRIRSNSS
ncbi:hypothetical protein QN219_27960 [Sinorhizobium sp. 7-81]|uniref:hypothetical protein n=1 Tax=Sinorhizobium sp. 8-89 TaxID=3049089 RepID=UPI0024C2A2E6|nr:hypothetical protein [Sinorhizobium sp. 8-89]MDK1493831.1 hypothetical protein [Sinorhizobium sp. 8-89]